MQRSTPCDFGDCPFDARYSEDCRVNCGLGVDDDDEFYEDLRAEQQEQC